MSYVDYERRAKEHRREVSRCYYLSRKYAKSAAREYGYARQLRETARITTRMPSFWTADDNPARWEGFARTAERLADTYLSESFRYHQRARFYAGLARDYDELARRAEERLARLRERLGV